MDFLGGPELFKAKLEDPEFAFEAVPLEPGFDFVPLIGSATRLHDNDFAYRHVAKSGRETQAEGGQRSNEVHEQWLPKAICAE